jgi:predicted phage terminase large subunit-like protein
VSATEITTEITTESAARDVPQDVPQDAEGERDALIVAPQEGPQELFLSTPADIAILGGSLYGGKTWSLVVEALRHVEVPDFNFAIFRRTTPEIKNPGGLWDEAVKWYLPYGAEGLRATLDWRFPSGARGKFAGLQYEENKTDWKGAQICLLMFDQLEEFTEGQFFYLLSRNRSSCGVRPYTRASANPDADSWLAQFISWWWDEESGYAIPERSGVVRWFLRVGDGIEWSDVTYDPRSEDDYYERERDARAELLERFGEKEAGRDGSFAKSVTFVLARLQDNKIGLALDPGYEANVRALDAVERERLLGGDRGGNWKVRPTAGKVFNRGWFEIVDAIPARGPKGELPTVVRAWDLAASRDGDFTVGVHMVLVGDVLYVVDVVRGQWEPGPRDGTILTTARADGVLVPIRLPQDPAQAGKSQALYLVSMLKGFTVRVLPVSGDKVTRAGAFASQASVGNVKLLRAEWNENYLRELHAFPTKGVPDDQVDASSDAANVLLGREIMRVQDRESARRARSVSMATL